MVNLSQFTDISIFSPLQLDLLNVLEKGGPMTRAHLVQEVESPRSTVYYNLLRLQELNLVVKFSRPRNTRGRPHVFFKVVEE